MTEEETNALKEAQERERIAIAIKSEAWGMLKEHLYISKLQVENVLNSGDLSNHQNITYALGRLQGYLMGNRDAFEIIGKIEALSLPPEEEKEGKQEVFRKKI